MTLTKDQIKKIAVIINNEISTSSTTDQVFQLLGETRESEIGFQIEDILDTPEMTIEDKIKAILAVGPASYSDWHGQNAHI